MKLVFKVLKEELELRYNMVVLLTNIIIIAHSLPLAKSTDTTFKSLLACFTIVSFYSLFQGGDGDRGMTGEDGDNGDTVISLTTVL